MQGVGKTTSYWITVAVDFLTDWFNLSRKRISEHSQALLACRMTIWLETEQLFVSSHRGKTKYLSSCPVFLFGSFSVHGAAGSSASVFNVTCISSEPTLKVMATSGHLGISKAGIILVPCVWVVQTTGMIPKQFIVHPITQLPRDC